MVFDTVKYRVTISSRVTVVTITGVIIERWCARVTVVVGIMARHTRVWITHVLFLVAIGAFPSGNARTVVTSNLVSTSSAIRTWILSASVYGVLHGDKTPHCGRIRMSICACICNDVNTKLLRIDGATCRHGG